MALLDINEPRPVVRGWAPFALGFRPFFLLAGIAAVVLLAVWGWAFTSGRLPHNYYGYIGWHSHEMLFGYVGAVIAGFLLTAARNWTGVQTLRGVPLALLALLWLSGRIAPFITALPHWSVALIDLSFLPLFAVALVVPLLRAKHYQSLVFVAIATALFCGNLLIHLQLLGITRDTAHRGTYLTVDLILLTIVVMGGRVIPFFTEKGVPSGFVTRSWPWVEKAAPISVLLLGLFEVGWPEPWAVGLAAAAAAIANGVRLYGWHTRGVWRVPLLWVLHVGYAFLVLGFALRALATAGHFPPLLALHALTIGGIGGISFGMMARVTLGHTGRTLIPPRRMSWAFALIYGATLARVFLPFMGPYQVAVGIAAALWVLAFGIFVVIYAPTLLRPRVDGRPG